MEYVERFADVLAVGMVFLAACSVAGACLDAAAWLVCRLFRGR